MSGWARWAPFGGPVVPEVRITKWLDSSGGSRSESSWDRISSSSVGSPASSPSVHATTPQVAARLRQQLRELAIVDQCDGLLALHDLCELRPRERRVHVQAVGAELRARERRLDEPTVVPAHDRHAVSRSHSGRSQAAGERVDRRCSSEKVSEPASSSTAASVGYPIAPVAIPAAGEAPQRTISRTPRANLSGRTGRITPASASARMLNGASSRLPSGPRLIRRATDSIGSRAAIERNATFLTYVSTRATAKHAIPSPRPIAPIPSLVVALTLTGAESASDSRRSISGGGRRGPAARRSASRRRSPGGPVSRPTAIRSRSIESAPSHCSSSRGKGSPGHRARTPRAARRSRVGEHIRVGVPASPRRAGPRPRPGPGGGPRRSGGCRSRSRSERGAVSRGCSTERLPSPRAISNTQISTPSSLRRATASSYP